MARIDKHTLAGIARRLREIPRPSRAGSRDHRRVGFICAWFRISSSAKDGANNRWVYTTKKLGPKSGAGYGGTWSDDPNDTADYTLYASIERINGSSGTYGNGVTQSNLDAVNDSGGGTDGTHALKPIPNNTPVFAVGMFLDDGTLEWWIPNLPNGVDGACPVPA